MRFMRFLNQRGDTIVEVLIAIAVVSSVLGISYATMNRNVLIGRDNQERSEAVRLGEGQIESLKSLASYNRAAIDAQGTTGFCLDGGTIVGLSGGAPAATAQADLRANYPAGPCYRNSIYRIGVRFDPGEDVYRVFVRWDSLLGSDDSDVNEVTMLYRH